MLQIAANIIYTASCITMVAISFSIIYDSVKFIHFTHAAIFTSGPYFTFLFLKICGIPIIWSIFLGILGGTLLGVLVDRCIFHPLRKKGSTSMIFLLVSLGTYIFLQNLISLVFGENTKTIREGVVNIGIEICGIRTTGIQIVTFFACIISVIIISSFLKVSKLGKAIRSVANDPELAYISGINSDKIILWSFILGSALSGITGILVALDVEMTPTMGMNALLTGVIAMIIGGVGNILGIALGAFLLSAAQHIGIWQINSTWTDAITFLILFLFLLFKPSGVLGKKDKMVNL